MVTKAKRLKIHVNKGDFVQVISGKYKGKTGEIKHVLRKTSQVIIKNINLKTKHLRPKNENEAGQTTRIEAPIHSSNVMLYSQKYKIASRYNKVVDKDKIKKRKLKKTQEIF